MKFIVITISLLFTLIIKAQQPYSNNSAEIFIKIKQLKVCGSVLYVAAHPDDENNGLLPYLTKEKFYRTAYLSLTRGEGGQNLIGSEQGTDLGLIRTQELLAARKIDGAEQYFTRAYEFGYSKTSNETLQIWDSIQVLSDIVWCIRKFQPDIIITRFPPDARAGHGHHSASAILANIAFNVAADSTKFTEQFKYGVQPHQAKRILWNTFNFGGNNTTNENQLKISFNSYNSLLGKNYGEIGAEARTMHKSQGEGRARRRGEIFEYFSHTDGEKASKDLMENIDLSWNKISSNNEIENQIDELIDKYDFASPHKSVKQLVNIYKKVKELPKSVWRNYKLNLLQELIENCSGLFIEAVTNQEYVVANDSLKFTFNANNRNICKIVINKIIFENFDSSINITLQTNKNLIINKSILIDKNKEITQPYWLKQLPTKGMFNVDNQLEVGNAENKPAFSVSFLINIEGEDFQFTKPILYKYVDLVKGELYQPLFVFPAATIEVDNEQKMITNKNSTEGKITIKNYLPNLQLKFENKSSLTYSIDSVSFVNNNLAKEIFYTNPERKLGLINPKLKTKNNLIINKTLHQIKYDHIPTLNYFTTASINIKKLNVKTNSFKVAYVIGAGDKVPQALLQLGYTVDILTEKDVEIKNLKQYKAIITGIRAYNIVDWLSSKNEVFNEYIKQGGNLIIQYVRGNSLNNKKIDIGPYNFSVNSSSRITNEDANVEFVLKNHNVLNKPNAINTTDFDNWIQERSTYQIENADSNFVFPLKMNDKNEKPSNGSLAIAKYGKGNVIYCSLALFRQLPAGVTGAFRLMSNMIEL